MVLGVALAGMTAFARAQVPSHGTMVGPSSGQNRIGQGYGHGMMGGQAAGPCMTDEQSHMMDGQGNGRSRMGGQGSGPGMMGAHGPGMMGGQGYGAGRQRNQVNFNISPDEAKRYFERMIAMQDNSRLKLGDVKEIDADTITVDIVTRDNSLVQRFVVNRHDGSYQADEG